jgi:hypothetical protein
MAKRIIIFLFMLAVVLGVITSLAHGVPNFVTINANESLLSINETTVTTNSSFPHIYGSYFDAYINVIWYTKSIIFRINCIFVFKSVYCSKLCFIVIIIRFTLIIRKIQLIRNIMDFVYQMTFI